MKRAIHLCLVLGTCYFFILTPLQAQTVSWPQFRGINSSGVANENQDAPVNFASDEHTLWNTALSKGCSSPCIWDNRIFLTGFDEEAEQFHMYCINRTNGSILWDQNLQTEKVEKVHRVSYPANATPVTDGERVIFYLSSYGLLCYDLDGEKQWEMQMPVPKSRHGMGTSPVIAGDLLILNCFGHLNDPCLLAIDKFQGEIVWKHVWAPGDDMWVDSYSTPVVYDDQVIIYRSADISSFDVKTGDQNWWYLTGSEDAVCTPVIGKDMLYVTVFSTFGNRAARAQFPDFIDLASDRDKNEDQMISKEELGDFQFMVYPEKGVEVSGIVIAANWFGWYDKNRDSYIDSTEWNSFIDLCESDYLKQGIKAIRLDGQGDITFSHFVWGASDYVPHVTSPLFYRDRVYMIKSGGILSCFQAEDGALLYSERIGAAGSYFASPIAVNGKIYFTSRDGIITILEDGEDLNILARNDLEEIISATPAIVDNKIYVRTDSTLYAFGIK